MKWLIAIIAMLPLSGMADTLNNNQTTQPVQSFTPDHNPSTQRMQNEMQAQQQSQQQQLQQEQQRQNQDMQRKMQEQRDQAQQQVTPTQPGNTDDTVTNKGMGKPLSQ